MAFDLDIGDDEEFPPLYLALLMKDLSAARKLIAQGATLDDLIEADGNTLLHRFARHGELEMIEFYLEQGCPQSLECFDHVQCTPLIWAAQCGHTNAVARLLSAGADPNGHDSQKAGDTPLREAVRTGRSEIIASLLRAGGDPTIGGWMNISAVDQAWISVESTREVMREIRAMLAAYPSRVRDRVHSENRRRRPAPPT